MLLRTLGSRRVCSASRPCGGGGLWRRGLLTRAYDRGPVDVRSIKSPTICSAAKADHNRLNTVALARANCSATFRVCSATAWRSGSVRHLPLNLRYEDRALLILRQSNITSPTSSSYIRRSGPPEQCPRPWSSGHWRQKRRSRLRLSRE